MQIYRASLCEVLWANFIVDCGLVVNILILSASAAVKLDPNVLGKIFIEILSSASPHHRARPNTGITYNTSDGLRRHGISSTVLRRQARMHCSQHPLLPHSMREATPALADPCCVKNRSLLLQLCRTPYPKLSFQSPKETTLPIIRDNSALRVRGPPALALYRCILPTTLLSSSAANQLRPDSGQPTQPPTPPTHTPPLPPHPHFQTPTIIVASTLHTESTKNLFGKKKKI